MSPDGTLIGPPGPPPSLVDARGVVWSIAPTTLWVLRNGKATNGRGTQVLLDLAEILVKAPDGIWWEWHEGPWKKTGISDMTLLLRSRRDRIIVTPGGVAPAFSVAPALIGTPQVGIATAYTLGTVSGTPTPTITQQWTLDGVDISGATGATYTPIAGDVTHLLRVREIATNGVGSPASSTSGSVTVLPASAASDRVKPSTAATSWLNASTILRSAWANPGGDWLDGAGVFNGSTPTITQFLAAAGAHTFNISGIDGDLLITGLAGYWDTPLIDGAAAAGFWVDSSSAQSIALPGRFGDPGYILNPGRGAVLSITTASPNETIRIEKVAGPLVNALPMVSTRAAPSIATLQMLNAAQIQAAIGTGFYITPYAYDDSFSTYNGMPYIRFAVPNFGERAISWYWMFPAPLTEVYTRYCIFIEDDVSDGMTELGVKLPGPGGIGAGSFGNQDVSWRMEHGAKDPANLDLYSAVDYRYAADTGGGFGQIGDFRQIFRANRWYVIEQYAKVNTYSGSTANSDGIGKVWINGNLVSNRTNLKWFYDGGAATAKFDNFYANVYHGGSNPPTQNIHYRFAEVGISATYMGPPAELQFYSPDVPAWRSGMTALTWRTLGSNIPASIDPEDNVAINPNHPADAPWHATAGFAGIIDDYSGGAYCQATETFRIAGGGHNAYYGNEMIEIALNVATPAWSLVRNPTGAIGNTGTLIPADYTNNAYFDGRPIANHTYNNLVWVGNTFYMVEGFMSPNGIAGNRLFKYTTDWTNLGFTTATNGTTAGGVAYDETRNALYYANFSAPSYGFTKYDIATATWSDVAQNSGVTGYIRAVRIPERDCIVLLVSDHSIAPRGFAVYDYGVTAGASIPQPPCTGSVPADTFATGVWVPSIGKIVLWSGGTGFDTLTPPASSPGTGTWVWGRLEAGGSNVVTPTTRNNQGTYGRLFHSQALRCMGLINRTTDSLYVFALD